MSDSSNTSPLNLAIIPARARAGIIAKFKGEVFEESDITIAKFYLFRIRILQEYLRFFHLHIRHHTRSLD